MSVKQVLLAAPSRKQWLLLSVVLLFVLAVEVWKRWPTSLEIGGVSVVAPEGLELLPGVTETGGRIFVLKSDAREGKGPSTIVSSGPRVIDPRKLHADLIPRVRACGPDLRKRVVAGEADRERIGCTFLDFRGVRWWRSSQINYFLELELRPCSSFAIYTGKVEDAGRFFSLFQALSNACS